MTKICIVTPDLIGPIRNGGIGTHCYYLARNLAKSSTNHVSIFFSGPYEISDRSSVAKMYADMGIQFFDLTDAPPPDYPRRACEAFLDYSLRIKDFLLKRDFDLVHFQDWQANGFASAQAKRSGQAFVKTKLVVTLHSSTQWIREGMRSWPEHPLQDLMIDYCERYVAQHADLVVSPSEYMLNWTKQKGWPLASRTLIAPYCFETPELRPTSSPQPINLEHLIFFGRLETRKGLELFCRAVEACLDQNSAGRISKITFLGKVGLTQSGLWADRFLETFAEKMRPMNVSVERISSYDSHQAIEFLRSARGCVFICSLQDNYPFTVIESLENCIPVIAARTGGIPELISSEALFETRVDDLQAAMGQRAERIRACRSRYSSDRAAQIWQSLSPLSETPPAKLAASPKVSVCVAYFNYGKYLPQLLHSLAQQSYSNFEVVVVNDGSTEELSRSVFEDLTRKYADKGWRFFSNNNQGIGATRNFAASKAQGELLIFMDADNIATPTMIERFVVGMQHSGVDCLTAHFLAFAGAEAPSPDFKPLYGYTPLGPCLAIGAIANIFGDANFCIKAGAFEKLGGFQTERSSSYEDYEFLARLALRGYQLDVIPDVLFYYRHLESGFSRTTDLVSNQKRVTKTYMQNLGQIDGDALFNVLVLPLAKQAERLTHQLLDAQGLLYQARHAIAERDLALKQYDRAGYRAATRLLSWIDKSPHLKAGLRDSLRALWRLLVGIKRVLTSRKVVAR